jgi:lactoylglutathione lyase
MAKVIKNCLHISFRVKDLEASSRFYHDILGFEKMFTMTKKDLYEIQGQSPEAAAAMADANTVWLAYFRIKEEQYLELFPVPEEEVAQFEGRQSFMHISLGVESIPDTVTELIKKGVPVYNTSFEMTNGKPLREGFSPYRTKCNSYIAWVADPDGNLIELMQLTDESLQRKADHKD